VFSDILSEGHLVPFEAESYMVWCLAHPLKLNYIAAINCFGFLSYLIFVVEPKLGDLISEEAFD
jgi:hypothetical protein